MTKKETKVILKMLRAMYQNSAKHVDDKDDTIFATWFLEFLLFSVQDVYSAIVTCSKKSPSFAPNLKEISEACKKRLCVSEHYTEAFQSLKASEAQMRAALLQLEKSGACSKENQEEYYRSNREKFSGLRMSSGDASDKFEEIFPICTSGFNPYNVYMETKNELKKIEACLEVELEKSHENALKTYEAKRRAEVAYEFGVLVERLDEKLNEFLGTVFINSKSQDSRSIASRRGN